MALSNSELLEARLAAATAAPPPDAGRRAAVAIALRWLPGEVEVLLMRRRQHSSDPWSGQVSLPGGHCEPDDLDAFATARREAQEELRVDLAGRARALGQLAARQAMARGKLLDLWITPCAFEVTAELEPVPGAEAELAFWLPLGRAARGELDHMHLYKDEHRELLLPAWRFDGHIIWGLTRRMLGALLEQLEPPAK